MITAEPLLPLRVVTDRTRSAAFISTALSSASMFGTFLFLTYYLQQNLGYSPIKTGLAFLPNSLALTVSAMFLSSRLQARLRPGVIVGVGMFISAACLLYLSRLGVHASYLTAIFPAMLVWGIGLGFAFPTNMANAITGVAPADAGVASATVNTMQQVGGSIGTALLSTIAASAETSYPADGTLAAAAHGYTTAFFSSSVLFLIAGVLALLLYRTKRPAKRPLEAAVSLH
jgi:predicted MFS family arabinose efflux permease